MTAHRTGDQGLVFRDLLTDLDENIDPNAVFPWFHRNLSKNEAVERLVQGEIALSSFVLNGLRNNCESSTVDKKHYNRTRFTLDNH